MVNRGLKTSIWGYKDANVPVWNFAPGPTYNAFINSGDAVRLTNNLDPQPRRLGNQWATGRPQLSDGAAGHQRAGDLALEEQLRGMVAPHPHPQRIPPRLESERDESELLRTGTGWHRQEGHRDPRAQQRGGDLLQVPGLHGAVCLPLP